MMLESGTAAATTHPNGSVAHHVTCQMLPQLWRKQLHWSLLRLLSLLWYCAQISPVTLTIFLSTSHSKAHSLPKCHTGSFPLASPPTSPLTSPPTSPLTPSIRDFLSMLNRTESFQSKTRTNWIVPSALNKLNCPIFIEQIELSHLHWTNWTVQCAWRTNWTVQSALNKLNCPICIEQTEPSHVHEQIELSHVHVWRRWLHKQSQRRIIKAGEISATEAICHLPGWTPWCSPFQRWWSSPHWGSWCAASHRNVTCRTWRQSPGSGLTGDASLAWIHPPETHNSGCEDRHPPERQNNGCEDRGGPNLLYLFWEGIWSFNVLTPLPGQRHPSTKTWGRFCVGNCFPACTKMSPCSACCSSGSCTLTSGLA